VWERNACLKFKKFDSRSEAEAWGKAKLRCGRVLPVTLKFGVFGDLTGDGSVGQDDAVVWTREQWPLADWIYRAGLVFKIDSDATSYAQVRKIYPIVTSQKLDQLQPFVAVFPQECTGQLAFLSEPNTFLSAGDRPEADLVRPDLEDCDRAEQVG
jgi:hypothetical protein